jgi:DnaJ-class molecular chaperone
METQICPQCHGNGYIKIKDIEGTDQIKQCWVCESKGEIKREKNDPNTMYVDSNGNHKL